MKDTNIANVLDAIAEYTIAKQKHDADLQRNIAESGSRDWGYSIEARETQDRMDAAAAKLESAMGAFIAEKSWKKSPGDD